MRHEESHIQRRCVSWFRLQFPALRLNLIAIPNGYKTSVTQARIAKMEGLVAGAADLFLFVPNATYHGMAIEMKTEKGRQQDTQKEWQAAVEAQGYKYVVCRSFEDFYHQVNNYLYNANP